MTDPFHSSKYSITRAKHHIGNLERQIAEFFKSEPYTQIIETNPQGTQNMYLLKLVKPMPVDLEGIAVDAVGNLRNSLDQAIYAINPVKNAFFPFAGSDAKFNEAMNGRCKALPKDIQNLLRTFKPYKGGDDLLWALNELCNTNKHGFLTPIAIRTTEFQYKTESIVMAIEAESKRIGLIT